MKYTVTLLSVLCLAACSAAPDAATDAQSSSSEVSVVFTSSSEESTSEFSSVASENLPTAASDSTFTLAEVQAHSSKSSCYTIVDDSVYDITSYIPLHPGGERDIMKICGRDGTSLFSRQHGRDNDAQNQLASMKIGVYVE